MPGISRNKVYDGLVSDDDGRVCHAIADDACRQTPGNFLRLLLANALSTLADAVASAKTTLPWLLLQIGAPAWMTGLVVPLREAGSMLPQLVIGAAVRRRALRKPVWVAGGIVQALCLAGMGAVAVGWQGLVAGVAVLALLVVFSLARGACSIAYKDVLGKTIPKTRRGRLSGWIGALSGGLAMVAGLGLGALPPDGSANGYAGLLFGGALLWALAVVAYARIVEYPGATDGAVDGMAEALGELALLRDDVPFRRFVVARALAMGSGLAAPFYVTLARDALGTSIGWLGAPGWFNLAAFFGLGVAHAGVRLGRKTYLVDLAEGNRRTDYVAVSNSVIGALLLVSGALGALAAMWSVPGAVLALGLAGLAGAALSRRWKAVS